ncbi:hypothetical protein TIFTF001_016723 [Ficus carica]|uniref:Uncharacterized protein n=1 Tax=Ficus carica TaxID=3494 RepID=A0AA88ATN0_FICCA|nr:hypothetical protein TIFTF001_016723 [Ficus carica]
MLGSGRQIMVDDVRRVSDAESIMGNYVADRHAYPHESMDDYQVPVFEADLLFPEDPIPVVPLQEIPPQEAEADTDADDLDPADVMADPEDQPGDPPFIVISSDDEEDEEGEEFVEEWVEYEGIEVDIEDEEQGVEMEDFEDDPEEILLTAEIGM